MIVLNTAKMEAGQEETTITIFNSLITFKSSVN